MGFISVLYARFFEILLSASLQLIERDHLRTRFRWRVRRAAVACPASAQAAFAALQGDEGLAADDGGAGGNGNQDDEMLGPHWHHVSTFEPS